MSIVFHKKFSIYATKKSVKIEVNESFHREVCRRFPNDTTDFVPEICDCSCENCSVRLVFSQLRRSLEAGIMSEAYYESKVIEILFLLRGDCTAGKKPEMPDGDMRAVASVKNIISSNLSDCPKIAELAVLTGTSASKLQSDFKEAFGKTIHEYLSEVRMVKALELLDCTDAPVYSIAAEVGCRKAGRFSEKFKKVYGVSPAEYRRIHGR